MSTLVVVEEILRESQIPMSVREIVERAGARLPSKSKTPDTVVARDLSMSIKKHGERSQFVRTSPGRYTLRALVMPLDRGAEITPAPQYDGEAVSLSSIGQRKPTAAPTPATPAGTSPHPAEIGGYLG
jgi:hypothetical protein